MTFGGQKKAKPRVFGQSHHFIYNPQKTLFLVENTNDGP